MIDEHIIETIREMQKELTTYALMPQIAEYRQSNSELADELASYRRNYEELKVRYAKLSADNDDALQLNKLKVGELESARQRISELESLYIEEKERCEKCFRTFHNVELSLREKIKESGNGSGIRDEDASLREALDMAEGYLRQIATIVFDGEVLDDWQHLTNRVRRLRTANEEMCDDANASRARIAELEALTEELAKETNDIRDSGNRAFIAALRDRAAKAEKKLEQSREASRETFRAIAKIVMPDGEMPFDWQILIRTMKKLRDDYNMLLDSRSIPLGPTRERFERDIAELSEKLSNQAEEILTLRHIKRQQIEEIQQLRHELAQHEFRLSDNLSVIDGQRAVIETMRSNNGALQARLLDADSPTMLPESPMLSVDPIPFESMVADESMVAEDEESIEGPEIDPDHRVSIPAEMLAALEFDGEEQDR